MRRERLKEREKKRRIEELGTLQLMRQDKDLVASMKEQDTLRKQADILYRTGDHAGAEAIMKRIDPSLEDPEKKLREERKAMKALSRS